jgi:hypothetical protein
MESTQLVDSYKFRDVVQLWARERMVHEVVVSHELVKGIVVEGLRFQSLDPMWAKTSETFRGYPFVGFSAREGSPPIVIRAAALEHLLIVMREGIDPSLTLLSDEFVSKGDFADWLLRMHRAKPKFWFD